MKRRLMAFVLVLVMVLGMSTTVSAATLPQRRAADALYHLDLFRGRSEVGKNFDLDSELNRAEGVVLLLRLIGEESAANQVDLSENPFADVTEEDLSWGICGLTYAYQRGLAKGADDGNGGLVFMPQETMKDYEFLTLVLRQLGYADGNTTGDGVDFVWNAPYELAQELGLVSSAQLDGSFTRGDAVQVSWNALKAEIKGTGETLAKQLIKAGVFTAAEYRDAKEIRTYGYILSDYVAPAPAPVPTPTPTPTPTPSVPSEDEGDSEPEQQADATADVEVAEDGTVKNAVSMEGETVSATVPAGVTVESGTEKLALTVSELEDSNANVAVEETEDVTSYDVHVEGVSGDNTVAILVDMGEILPVGMNMGNVKLYHVENGVPSVMTQVGTPAELDAHNEFYYDPATGNVTVAMATFSEIAVVQDTENAWNGDIDYSWYTNAVVPAVEETEDDYTIANADQLAAFGAIVGGMAKDTDGTAIAQDSFTNKTVKLIADINLGDDEDNNVANKIFYPIGYYNNEGTYEKTNTAITSGFYTFEGTFDGNGHTISNFYQNTWEMKGDHNWYDATLQYYRDGMGLFGKVYGGTVKNLTVDNFSSDGEITTTGVIAAYADGATFENIAITNCNPRVYNIGNGGIVGCVGWYAKEADLKTTFKNITVDNTNKISALWGSYDVACGGLVGQYYPTSGQSSANYPQNAGIHMENCHVSAQIDVYNDVCANYQYYAYRYAGMMIGSIRENETIDGHVYPKMDGITASGCTVHFGDWNDYYYCELVDNTTASYTHDYQMSRLEQVAKVEETTITPLEGEAFTVPTSGRCNYVVVNQKTEDGKFAHATENATCYHFKDGEVWMHDMAGIQDGMDENGDGEDDLKEDKQHIYLEFNNLVTGYGWGVTTKGVDDMDGVIILDRAEADSVEKFTSTGKTEVFNNIAIKASDLVSYIENCGVDVYGASFHMGVTDLDDTDGTVTAKFERAESWGDSTITFTGTGEVLITIQDYYFCTPTNITVNVTERQDEEKFDVVLNNGDFLHRVGNQNTVKLGSLFAAKSGTSIGTVSVTIEALNGTAASGDYTSNTTWANGTIQFSGTGVVKVTIQDYDYCIPTVLYLEVVDAVNATTATSATSNNVVLLNDTSGTFSVTNGYTFYGNGFKVQLPTTSVQNVGQGFTGYISIGASQDDGIANGGNLDNVRIEGPVYPEMYIYRDQAKITDSSDADYGDGYNMRYFKNSVIVYGGNVTISNCYISGSRTALCLRGGNNVVVENTTLFGGAYANMQICAGSNVTLRNLTTVQVDVTDSYGKGKTAHGLGIAVDSNVVDIYIEGELNQYNWLCKEQWNSIVPSDYQSSFPDFFGNSKYSKYWHYLNGDTTPYVNLTFIYACNWDTSKIHDDRTTVDYETCDSTIAGVAGGVYSKVNTVGGNAITDANLKDPGYTSPGFNPVAPVFNFDNTANDDADDANDATDSYCVYDEGSGTLKIGVTGDSKTIDLSGVSATKNGATLEHTAYLNGTQISGDSVTIKAADGAKQTLTFKATSNDAGYDKDGNSINGSIEYTWTVTVEMAVLAYPAPVWNMGGDYQFDTSNCVYAYYSTSNGYGEAVPIYEGIKVTYYNKSGTLVNVDLSGTTTLPTGSENSNSNAFTYTLADGSTLTMKFSSGWKSGATTHQFTTYNNKVYIYPQSLDNDNYIRAKTTNQDFDVKITYNFTDPNGQSTGDQTMQWYNAKASNGSVSTVQWKTFDSTNGKKASVCITPDTLVTMGDGTKKEIQYVSVGEEVLAWNFHTGAYEVVPTSLSQIDGRGELNVLHLYFEDGTELKVLGEHGIFDSDLNTFIFIDEGDVEDYLGHSFVKQDGDGYATVKLVDYEVTTEDTFAYTILSAEHYNVILEDMFTVTPAHVGDNFFNPFEIGEGLKYDEASVQADIEKYGLYTYEDFDHVLTYEQFVALNLGHLKVSVGKGLVTYDGLIYLIENFINRE